MDLANLTIGYGITGSFCTHARSKKEMEQLLKLGAKIVPIFSYATQQSSTRFGKGSTYVEEICQMTNDKGICSIVDAEPIGPQNYLDIMVIAPCTGNTAAKLWSGIVDTPVLMAAKAHLRNGRPLVLAMATNDAMGMNFKTIGNLMNCKNIYFVPFGQDNFRQKPNSLVADFTKLPETITEALCGRQYQPLLLQPV